MPRLTKIYTRKGDDGSTALGTGRRVGKDDSQVEAYGEVDELNAAIGAALASGLTDPLPKELSRIQSELFNLGGELCLIGQVEEPAAESAEATPRPKLIQPRHVAALESTCDRLNAELGALENFILPGGTEGSSRLHLARTICRRAERRTVTLSRHASVPGDVISYLNRLSDLLFIMARYENRSRGVEDILWDTSV